MGYVGVLPLNCILAPALLRYEPANSKEEIQPTSAVLGDLVHADQAVRFAEYVEGREGDAGKHKVCVRCIGSAKCPAR